MLCKNKHTGVNENSNYRQAAKKQHYEALIITLIAGILSLTAVVVLYLFDISSQNSQVCEETPSIVDENAPLSDIDIKFNQIIKENEQLKAWWDCEKEQMSSWDSNLCEEYAGNINNSLKSLKSLINFYPNINVTAASPSKYAKIDMNGDGHDELVVMGKNPYSSEAIIGVYYYDAATGNVKMTKVSDSSFNDFSDCYTDVICADRTIKSTYSANGGETLSVYKMQGDTVIKVGDYSGYFGKPQNQTELIQAQNQNIEFCNIKNSYVEDGSISWTEFNSVDPVYTMAGIIKVQATYDRMTDPNSRSAYIDSERENTDFSSPYYDKKRVLLIFERDAETETPLFSAGGAYIVSRKIIAYCLGGTGNYGQTVLGSSDYAKLKEYENKKVTLTLNMKYSWALSDAPGWGVDAFVGDNSVVSVSETG